MSSPANKFIEIFRYYDVQLSTANEKKRCYRCCQNSGVTMGWMLRPVTGGPLVVGAPDSSRVLSD